jgi:hypothetical protein
MDNDKYSAYRQLAIATMIPIILVVAPLLGYYGGGWVDGKFATGNVFKIIGLALGFGAAGKEIYGLIKSSTRKPK